MARTSLIDALPLDIQDSLIRQYLDNPGWTLNDHVAWLEGVGYKVSRSSLHRYLFGRKETFLQAQAEKDNAIADEMSMRQRCLEVAATLYKGDDHKELIGMAEDLLDWIQQTDAVNLPVESFYRE